MEWRKIFHLDKVHSCFWDVLEMMAVDWAILTEWIRSMRRFLP
jgi:hypothetical protein